MKRTLLRAFADATPDPILILDQRARVLEYSPPATELLPDSLPEIRDLALGQIFDLTQDIERDIIERGLARKSPSPVRLVPGDRSAITQSLHGEVWRLGGEHRSWVGLRFHTRSQQIEAFRELTERLDRVTSALRERDAALRSLRAKEDEARRVEAAARIGSWRCAKGESVLRLSEQARKLICPDSDSTTLAIAAYVEQAHYADQDRLLTFFKKVGSDPVSAEIEHGLVIDVDGESIERNAWLGVEPEHDEDGTFLGHLGFIQDLSELHKARKELDEIRRLRDLNERILDSVGEGIYGLSPDGETTFVNRAAEHILGWEAQELLGKPQHDLIHHSRADGSAFPEDACPISATRADGKVRHVDDDVFWRKDGTLIPVSYTVTSLADRGEGGGVVVSFRDNTHRVTRERELKDTRDRLAEAHDRAARERDLLLSLGRRLIDARDLDGVVRGSLSEISKWLYDQDAYAEAWVANTDAEPGWRLHESWVGDRSRFRDFRDATIDLAQGELPAFVARAAAAASPQWIVDVSSATATEFTRAYQARACGLRTTFSLPVRDRDDTQAILVFALPDCRANDADFTELMEAVSNQVSAAFRAKLDERDLKESEERFRTIVENLPVPLVITRRDKPGQLFVNKPAEKLVRHQQEAEDLGTATVRYAEPGARDTLWAKLEKEGRLDRYPVEFLQDDGARIEAEVTSRPLTFAGQDALCTIIMDVTEARTLARDLQLRNKDLSETQRAAKIGQWSWRQGDPGAEISVETARLLGLDPDRGYYSIDELAHCVAPVDRVRVRRAIRDLFREGQPLNIRHGTMTEEQEIHMSGQPEFDETGTVVRVQGFSQDVTELAEAHRRLRNDSQFLEALLDNLGESIIACDSSGQFRLFNKVAERTHGPLKLGASLTDIADEGRVFDSDGATPIATEELPLSRAFFKGEQIRDQMLVIRRDNGSDTRLICNAQPILDDTGRKLGAVVVQRDISEQHALKEAARQREGDFERMFNASREGTFLVHPDGTIREANRAACEMHGFKLGDLNGLHASMLVHPDHAQELTKFLERTQSGETYFAELRDIRRDGSEFPVEVVGAPIELAGRRLSIATVRDITERKQLQDQAVQAQRMEAVGQLTGGVAHDFNNLLQAIMMNLDFLESGAAGPEDAKRTLETTMDAVEKGAELIQQMLAFSRRQTLAPKWADINSIVLGMLPLLRRSAGEAVEVIWTPSEATTEVLLDQVQFESMLLNLTVNARDAMPNGGRLEIESSIFEMSHKDRERRVAFNPEQADLATGSYARLRVRDNGVGIPADILEKIFEPFFTTKEVGKGAGLGLAMAFGFVRQSNGFITVQSEVGKGTEFRIHFPLNKKARNTGMIEQDQSRKTELPGGTETILVVDDNDAVRESVELRLDSLGYRVVSARDVNEAIETLEKNPNIELVFSDVVMPGGLSGIDLAKMLQERSPRIAVILTSGFGGDALERIEGIQAEILKKPYRTKELATRIRNALDARQDER